MIVIVIIMVTIMLRRIGEAAPGTPLFYYHIPGFSGVSLPMAQFLQVGASYMNSPIIITIIITIIIMIIRRREANQSQLLPG